MSGAPRGPLFRTLVDVANDGSVAARLRRRRAELFRATLLTRYREPRILDVGGMPEFWVRVMPAAELARLRISCLNLQVSPPPRGLDVDIEMRYGDACDMRDVGDGEFDIAFSNSVIEHVGDLSRQRAMAAEVRRVARSYWVQTPNRLFPLEPHYLFPFFQFLPRAAKHQVARHWPFGWMPAGSAEAMDGVTTTRLLTAGELKSLFPDGTLVREHLLGLTKSLVMVRV